MPSLIERQPGEKSLCWGLHCFQTTSSLSFKLFVCLRCKVLGKKRGLFKKKSGDRALERRRCQWLHSGASLGDNLGELLALSPSPRYRCSPQASKWRWVPGHVMGDIQSPLRTFLLLHAVRKFSSRKEPSRAPANAKRCPLICFFAWLFIVNRRMSGRMRERACFLLKPDLTESPLEDATESRVKLLKQTTGLPERHYSAAGSPENQHHRCAQATAGPLLHSIANALSN